jgi:hypothetical protein
MTNYLHQKVFERKFEMTQFRLGQKVEVRPRDEITWCRAKIITVPTDHPAVRGLYEVEFPGGDRAVYNAAHIRATA